MKNIKRGDPNHLYKCPHCLSQSLVLKKSDLIICTSCNFNGKIHMLSNDDLEGNILTIEIKNTLYAVNEYKNKDVYLKDIIKTDDLCIINNNELIIVSKESLRLSFDSKPKTRKKIFRKGKKELRKTNESSEKVITDKNL